MRSLSLCYERIKLRPTPENDLARTARLMVKHRGYPEDLLDATWSAIPEGASHLRVIGDYLDEYPVNDRAGAGLILTGPYASGKTMLACLVAVEAASWGAQTIFVRAHELAVALANPGKRRCPSGENLEVAAEAVHVLTLDDFGAEDQAPWITRGIEDVIRSRCNSRLPTIITTNLATAAFPPWLSSLVNRGKFIVVEVTETDFGSRS